MEVEATPDKKKPPLWEVQQNRATTPIVSRSGKARPKKTSKMRAKPYPSPGKVELTPSQRETANLYQRLYQKDVKHCNAKGLDLKTYRIQQGRAKAPKVPQSPARKAYQKAYRESRKKAKAPAMSFGSTPTIFPPSAPAPPIPAPTAAAPPIPAPTAAAPPIPAPTAAAPPIPAPTAAAPPIPAPTAAAPPIPAPTAAAPPPPITASWSSTPPPTSRKAPWSSTPPSTSRKEVFAKYMTPEQRSDVVASKKRCVARLGTVVETLWTNSTTMNTNSLTMQKDSATIEKVAETLTSEEDDLQELIYLSASANLLNRFENADNADNPPNNVDNPPNNADNPPNNEDNPPDLETAYNKCCSELKEYSAFFNRLKADADAGVRLPCIEVVTKLISDIDSVHIAGTEEQKGVLHDQKREHLMSPLKKLCTKFSIEVDWDYYDL